MSHHFYKNLRGKIDLQNCHLEPIEVPGAIQSHGLLLVCAEPDLTVLQVSENVEDLTGVTLASSLGATIETTLGPVVAGRLLEVAKAESARFLEPFSVDLRGSCFEVAAHRTEMGLIVEVEPAARDDVPLTGIVRAALMRLRECGTVLELCRTAAQEIRALSGFDRVMVYRFDPDWNGEVIAEAKHEDLGTYLGLAFPARDIPAQARRLYTLNPVRAIPDVSYTPAALEPEISPLTSQRVDLSQAALRSVSPVHCEYLRKMGVGASMSVSLLVGGKLWGLIACHHRSAFPIPSSLRSACELVAGSISAEIPRASSRAVEHRCAATAPLFDQLGLDLSDSSDPTAAVQRHGASILQVTHCDGMAAIKRGHIASVGLTPNDRDLTRLAAAVAERFDKRGLFHTKAARELLPEFPLGELVGLLGLDLWSNGTDILMLFRREHVSTVTWGTKPDKQLSVVNGTPKLSPEGSFARWKQTVEGHSLAWGPELETMCTRLRATVSLSASRRTGELERINDELAAATQAQDEFLAMLSHELRNPLNAILGWSRLLKDGTVTDRQMPRAVGAIHRNAEVQLQLIEDLLDISRIINGKMHIDPRPLDIREPVRAAIDTLRGMAETREVEVSCVLGDGADVLGDPDRLQQVFWNLLSNAIKFSSRQGRVRVSTAREHSSVVVRVEDSGHGITSTDLPHLFGRFVQGRNGDRRGGLGLGLSIVKGLVELHGGTVSAESPGVGYGSTFSVRFPAAPVREVTDAPRSDASSKVELSPLAGMKVLVIDDEPDSVELLVTILKAAGAHVDAADGVVAGLAALEGVRPDAIVSDIGMPGGGGWAVARGVQELPTPRPHLIALTAHARIEDRVRVYRAGFKAHMAKPVDPNELVALLASVGPVVSVDAS